ncbi:hypothetical protein KNE206_36170 [Kitasatospora sp. NE20-6]|uniref:hypothetical protein n=1 Tax=Kitasatospora sp. NE20-6 TaxID=2859066 RepID=UPI0034DC91D0
MPPTQHRPVRLLTLPLLLLALLASLLLATAPQAGAATPPQRILLAGQSTKAAWDDMSTVTDAPAGGSVYYEVASGTWVSPAHRDYAAFLASQGRTVQIGISWKDNPPGYTGGDRAARSRAVTQELADGRYTDRFATLIAFVNQYPQATFLLRIDYEVSSAYHCTDSSCSSYKGAFARIRSLIGGQKRQGNVQYVYHPVRGEYAQLYPGDAVTDRIGVSVFAHELCLPIYDHGYLWNGTPPNNYDTGTLQCRNPYIGTDSWGNPAAIWKNWDYDGNVLGMMKFTKDHGKTMIVSEGGMMNFTADNGATDGMEQARGALWMQRLFGLLNYNGPIPNQSGTYDLSRVVTAVTYIDLDFRYGWDAVPDGTFDFPPDTTWFVDGRISRYAAARTAFCQGLAANGFTTHCR